jgi:hypothetical protein
LPSINKHRTIQRLSFELKAKRESKKMNDKTDIISTLEELETFLISVEGGGLGLKNVAGVAMATNNKDGRRFVAVLDDKQQLILSRWVTEEVFQTGQDRVRFGPNHTQH